MLTKPPIPYDLCVADPISRWINACLYCLNSVLNVKAVIGAFNQEKALVGAFSVITNLRMELFEALVNSNLVSQYSKSHSIFSLLGEV